MLREKQTEIFRRIRTSVIPENRMRILLRSKALGLFIKYQRCRLDYFRHPPAAALVMGKRPHIRQSGKGFGFRLRETLPCFRRADSEQSVALRPASRPEMEPLFPPPKETSPAVFKAEKTHG